MRLFFHPADISIWVSFEKVNIPQVIYFYYAKNYEKKYIFFYKKADL